MTRLVLIAALCMAACMPKNLPVRAGTPPSPADASVAVMGETFDGAGGVKLFARSWRRAEQPPKGVLVIVHGLRDHGDRYDGFARRLVAAGYAVYAADLRGHGRSSGPRVWVDAFDDYVADLDIYVAKVRAAEPGAPLFLMGHSMGGAIVTRFVEERQPAVAGVVLSAPALGLYEAPDVVGGLVGGRRINGRLPLLKLKNRDFSRDRAVVEAMGVDPLITNKSGPGHTALELALAIGAVWDDVGRFDKPLLVVHGTGDKVTPPAASRDFVASVPSGDRTIELYEGYWHDLLHEPGGDQVASDIQAWIDGRAAAPAPPAAVLSARPLKGDAWHSLSSVQTGLGGLRKPDGDIEFDGAMRTSLGYGAPIGWTGSFSWDMHIVSLFPAGVALRLGDTGQLGIAGGVGYRGSLGAFALGEASLDVPLGWVRGFATGQVGWELGDDAPGDLAASVDDIAVRVGLLLDGDHRIGRRAYAAGGLVLSGGYQRRDGGDIFGILVGFGGFGAR